MRTPAGVARRLGGQARDDRPPPGLSRKLRIRNPLRPHGVRHAAGRSRVLVDREVVAVRLVQLPQKLEKAIHRTNGSSRGGRGLVWAGAIWLLDRGPLASRIFHGEGVGYSVSSFHHALDDLEYLGVVV